MRKLHARLASLEKRIMPCPSAALDQAVQRALVRLTCEELNQLIEVAKLKEEGREGELTAEHDAAIRRQDDLIAEERALAPGRS